MGLKTTVYALNGRVEKGDKVKQIKMVRELLCTSLYQTKKIVDDLWNGIVSVELETELTATYGDAWQAQRDVTVDDALQYLKNQGIVVTIAPSHILLCHYLDLALKLATQIDKQMYIDILAAVLRDAQNGAFLEKLQS